jgi:hypothetical protein
MVRFGTEALGHNFKGESAGSALFKKIDIDLYLAIELD